MKNFAKPILSKVEKEKVGRQKYTINQTKKSIN